MWNLKNGTNELIYKTEIESQTHRKQTYGHHGRDGGRDKLGDWD